MVRTRRSLSVSLLAAFATGACGGAGPSAPGASAALASSSDVAMRTEAPAVKTVLNGQGWSATVPYEGEVSELEGYSSVKLRGDGHEASCRLYPEPPESFRDALAEAVNPWPAENTWRRALSLDQVRGQPVVTVSLMMIPGDPHDTRDRIDGLSGRELDTYEQTQITLGITQKQFVICRPTIAERAPWHTAASQVFMESLTFEDAPPPPVRTTITAKIDPDVKVRSREYGFKWWFRLEEPGSGTKDVVLSFGFWGNLSKALAGRSVEVTDPSGQVANIAYFPGMAGEVQADSALHRLDDGRYAYAIGNGKTLFHVRTKLSSPLDTEAELIKHLKSKGAYSFTVQKYMPYVSQSHAVDVKYSRLASDPPDAVRIQVEKIESRGELDSTGRAIKMERDGKNGLNLYRRVHDSAGHLPKD